MAYCSIGVKATVNYKFGNGNFKAYSTNKTPIEVDASERYTPPFAAGQCPVQHWVDYNVTYQFIDGNPDLITFYYYGVANGQPVYGNILDIYSNCTVGGFCGAFNSVQGLAILYFDYRTQTTRATGLTHTEVIPSSSPGHAFNDRFRLISYEITSVRPVDGQSNNCGNPQPVCTLKVLHNNQVIFTDKGDCPITFNVLCGEECPPGTTKCHKSGYPGYCCLPCSPIKSEIAAITNQIKRLNNG